MGVFVQKVALDFGDRYVRLYHHDSNEYTEELQSKLFVEFQTSQFRFRKKTKSRSFSSMFASGVIYDSDLLSSYIRFLLSRAGLGKFALARIDLYLTVPTLTIPTTKQIWSTVLERVGISKVTFVSHAIAGAIGAGYSFPISTVAVIAHLGQSSSEIAAVSLHECLFCTPLSFTGSRFASQIRARYFAQVHQELTLQDCSKIEGSIGAVLSTDERKKKQNEIAQDTIVEFGQTLLSDVQSALEKLSIEELSLCSSQGIVLTGELAKQEGIAKYLSRNLTIPVYSANDPEMACARGLAGLISYAVHEDAL